MLLRPVVPVAMRQHTRVGGDIEISRDRRRESWEASRLAPGVERLHMTPGESGPELELSEGHADVIVGRPGYGRTF